MGSHPMAIVQYTHTHTHTHTHVHTHTIHRTTQKKKYIEQHRNFGRVRAVPHLCGFYPGICLTSEEKAWKNDRAWKNLRAWKSMNIHHFKEVVVCHNGNTCKV